MEKRVQALEEEVAALKMELAEMPQQIGKTLLAAAKRKAALADEQAGSYAEFLRESEKAKNEEIINLVISSVQAIKCSNLAGISQDIAIGVILAKVLLQGDEQQKRLIR